MKDAQEAQVSCVHLFYNNELRFQDALASPSLSLNMYGGDCSWVGKHPKVCMCLYVTFLDDKKDAWRILPVSNWLITMASKPPKWGCSVPDHLN